MQLNAIYHTIDVGDNVQVLLNKKHDISKVYRGILFLDRDGVLIEDPGYLGNPANVSHIYGANNTVDFFLKKGFAVCIITNQSGINRGYYTWQDYKEVTVAMLKEYSNMPTIIVACACKPSDINNDCKYFRKPSFGMIRLCQDLIKIVSSDNRILVGDKLSDLICGKNAGIKKLFHVLTGHGRIERSYLHEMLSSPDCVRCIEDIRELVDVYNLKDNIQ